MKKIFALLGCMWLAACSQAAPPAAAPLNFSQLPPLRFNVAEIRVAQNYQSPGVHPNVEQEFSVPPAKAVAQWAADRLQAVGSSGFLVVNIDDASVRQTLPPKKTGIDGVFAVQQVPYHATLNVTFRLYDGVHPLSVAEANVTVTRTRTLKDDANPVERAAFYDGLTRDLMTSFDAQAGAQIHPYFAAYLR